METVREDLAHWGWDRDGQYWPHCIAIQYGSAGIALVFLLLQKVTKLNTEQYCKIQTNNCNKLGIKKYLWKKYKDNNKYKYVWKHIMVIISEIAALHSKTMYNKFISEAVIAWMITIARQITGERFMSHCMVHYNTG